MDQHLYETSEPSENYPQQRHHAAWGALVAGAALSVYGWTRKSVSGAALGVAGGAIALKAASAGPIADMIGSERSCCRSVLIMRTAEELYAFWKDVDKVPQWMQQIKSARRIDDLRTRWVRPHPVAGTLEWTTEFTEDIPTKLIAWRTAPGTHSNYELTGRVEFHVVPNNRGTQVTLTLRYRLHAGLLHAGAATIIGENPEQEMRENLRHFKMLMEAGEIATIQGQSHGSRKMKGKLKETLLREEPKLRAASAEAS
jgi:uncharacterized membrane protein